MVSFSQPNGLRRQPGLKALQEVQEEIYRQLHLLIPDHMVYHDSLVSRVSGSPALRLEVIERLRSTGKPLVLAVNKCDGLDPALVYDYVSSPYVPYLSDEFTFTRQWMIDTIAKIFDVQNKKFSTVTCVHCRYTEVYKTDTSTLGNVFDFFTN